jgi:hypothetical protein
VVRVVITTTVFVLVSAWFRTISWLYGVRYLVRNGTLHFYILENDTVGVGSLWSVLTISAVI